MRDAIKILIILGMIFGFWAIYPLVVGIVALKKFEEARTNKELQGIAIITLIFCSTIAGILMLIISDNDLQKIN